MQLVPLFLLLVTGCMPPGTDGFGGGGSKNRPDGGDDSAAGDDTEAADDDRRAHGCRVQADSPLTKQS